jgi:hypothetical protein
MVTPKLVSKYRIAAFQNEAPKAWKIYASTDNSTWVEMDSQSDQSIHLVHGTYSNWYNFTAPVMARYLVIHVTRTIGGTGDSSRTKVQIIEMDFDGDGTEPETSLSGTINIAGSLLANKVQLDNYSIYNDNDYLRIKHTTGSNKILGQPMINAATTFSTCHIDYSTMLPTDMLAPITIYGGSNKCWGQTATYKANESLFAGRVVSLADQTVGTDSSHVLKVGYLKVGSAIVPANTPIGITQHNCSAGDDIIVCVRGYTTAITSVADASPERGSVVLAGADVDLGKIRIGVAPAAVQARVGFCAQSNAVVVGGPVLIHYEGFFQAT